MNKNREECVIPVVDESDNFIRWASRKEVHNQELIHRSVNVLVFDDQDRLLLQLRHQSKATQPSCWDLSCSGHVERVDHRQPNAGREASDRSVIRELNEELGVSVAPHFVTAVPPIPDVAYEYMQLYTLRHSGPFTLQPDEVEAVRWVSVDAILQIRPITRQLRWFALNAALFDLALATLQKKERDQT